MTQQAYSMYQLLDQKKRGQALADHEIKWMIEHYTYGHIPDYQMAAMLMCIYAKGMSVQETAALTDAMLFSGHKFDFKGAEYVDKHSTGGIGDKATFILAPIAAAAGLKIPMIAGRGLGFTGGTIDKIESIKGFKTKMPLEDFEKQVKEKGLVLIGQTPEIAPADGLVYALRDVTATIDSIPLITASIMSKKLAEGANGFVFDIKVGSGAFMREKKQAKELALSLIRTSKRFKKKSVALLTDMSQPLGHAVGHSLEVRESIETLKGKGPQDLSDLSFELAAHMIHIGGKAKNIVEARKKVKELVKNGEALKWFKNMILWQGGDINVIEDFSLLKVASERTEVPALKKGFIKSFVNDQIGLELIHLGGGRKTKDDILDLEVGFVFHKKISDAVKKNESILTIYHHSHQKEKVDLMVKNFQSKIIHLSSTKSRAPKLIDQVLKG